MMEARQGSTLEVVDKAAGASAPAPPPPALTDEIYAMPATQGQVRFWSLDSLNPGNPALNMPLMWQCTGPLDTDLLRAAFAQCVLRHESLRTTFAVMDGKLAQVIHPPNSPAAAVPIVVEDLTELAGEAQALEADERTREHAAFRFDLSTGPLLSLRLLKLGAQNHLLLVTMHHIICDGISNGILMRDMEAFYEADLHHAPAHLPELPIQFADYAVWHEEWRHGEEHAASLEFWRKTLGQGFSPIRLPHDADAPAALPEHLAGSTGAIDTLLVPPDLTARAHAFCVREGVTLNVLLFSVFCALLNRITGQHDLAIGSPCANRSEDTEELIGLFMNIQVLRVRLDASSSFRDLLRQVNTWTLAATEHQALMFEDLVHDPFFGGESALEIPIFFLYQRSFMLTKRIESPSLPFSRSAASAWSRDREGPSCSASNTDAGWRGGSITVSSAPASAKPRTTATPQPAASANSFAFAVPRSSSTSRTRRRAAVRFKPDGMSPLRKATAARGGSSALGAVSDMRITVPGGDSV